MVGRWWRIAKNSDRIGPAGFNSARAGGSNSRENHNSACWCASSRGPLRWSQGREALVGHSIALPTGARHMNKAPRPHGAAIADLAQFTARQNYVLSIDAPLVCHALRLCQSALAGQEVQAAKLEPGAGL